MDPSAATLMTYPARLAPVLAFVLLAACDVSTPLDCCTGPQNSLRVVNAFTGPVDVLVDGNVALASVAAGAIVTTAAAPGSHAVALRPSGSSASVTQTVNTVSGAMNTLAAVRSTSGAIGTAVLDDTNSVVPTGATKLRVLHLAPNAGTLQVYRTQPDYQQPISWQFPFTYQAEPTSLSAPFYQSTVGTWEVRIWQSPADASGWANAPVKVVLPLGSGEKKTILILDAPGGGVRTEIL
jgi:hypothetical protein